AVAHAPRLDDALLSVREADERAELDDLRLAEVRAQARPERVVDAFGVPDEHARVQERGLLALVEAVGALELEQLAEVLFGRRPLPARESPLRPSVVAVDRLRDVDPAELLERVVEDPLPEDALPRAHECLRDDGDVEANRL